MTLGCGAPGGNITSDNIGPQHLMNIKRIAWESRGIEHRTIPADQRMAGAAPLAAPEAAQAKSSVATVEQALFTPSEVEGVLAPSVEAGVSTEGGQKRVSVLPDRATIAHVVEHVMASHGIARGSGATKSAPVAKELPSPSAVAAEIAGRLFGSSGRPKPDAVANFSPASSSSSNVEPSTPSTPPPKSEAPRSPLSKFPPSSAKTTFAAR